MAKAMNKFHAKIKDHRLRYGIITKEINWLLIMKDSVIFSTALEPEKSNDYYEYIFLSPFFRNIEQTAIKNKMKKKFDGKNNQREVEISPVGG